MEKLARGIWRVGRGRPRIAVLGGVHGNERVGIEVVQRLVARFSEASTLPKQHGELLLAIGNPEAVERNVRFVDIDLNRCFSDQERRGSNDGDDQQYYEIGRAMELAPLLRGLDVLLDLHATNKPSEPFVRLPGRVCSDFFGHCEQTFLQWLPRSCRKVLWDPDGHIAQGSMADEFALRHCDRAGSERGAYICYEAGLASDTTGVDETEASVIAMLSAQGLLSETAAAPPTPPRTWDHYKIVETILLDDRGFEWENGHGEANFDPVASGEVFGRRASDQRPLTAKEDLFVIFPKVSHLWAVGRPLGWLARRLGATLR